MTRFTIGDNYTEAVTEVPVIVRSVDETPNDSDKTFNVPEGELWHLNMIFVQLQATAIAGNRQICVEVRNSDGVLVGRISAGTVQSASTTRYYQCMQGTYRETSFINSDIQLPIPQDAYMPSGFQIRVYDSAAIDPTGDDMTVGISVKKYKGF